MYTYAAKDWDLSIVQGPFSVAPCRTLALRFAAFAPLYSRSSSPHRPRELISHPNLFFRFAPTKIPAPLPSRHTLGPLFLTAGVSLLLYQVRAGPGAVRGVRAGERTVRGLPCVGRGQRRPCHLPGHRQHLGGEARRAERAAGETPRVCSHPSVHEGPGARWKESRCTRGCEEQPSCGSSLYKGGAVKNSPRVAQVSTRAGL
jgi:hypothetical protein